jgi:hypothetical protein
VNVPLQSALVPVAELGDKERQQMLDLMVRFYENVSPQMFFADLAEKPWVIQVTHPETGELCGFSTQMVLEQSVGSRRIKAMFSGDTIIDQRYWGDPALLRETVRFSRSLIDRWPGEELYWFLLSQGYKTYRLLPLFFREFYPCYQWAMPPRVQAALDALAGGKYPQRYDAARGVIRVSSDQYHLRPGVADVTPQRERDPHVRYFLERNSGHLHGEELCCLAPLSRENFTPAGERFLR